MRRRTVVASLLVLIMVLGASPRGIAAPVPRTIQVGQNAACDFDNIEDAIADARSGDTIKVENLIFPEQPLVIDKSLVLAGGYVKAGHPDQACLTQTGVGRTTVQPAVATTHPLLTVRNVRVTVSWFIFEQNGGNGIAVEDGLLNLEHVIVRDNSAVSGGGLHVLRSTATLVETEIADNSADWGGGLYLDQSSTVSAHGSTIHDNSGQFQGAGVYLTGGSTFSAFEETHIELNVTAWGCEDGGGIYADGVGTEVTIDASGVLTNTALSRGGGLYIGGGATATIQNSSWIQANGTYGPTEGGGGGIHVSGSHSTLAVSMSAIDGNWSDPNGGGIHNDGGTVYLNYVYLTGNHGGDNGGGLYNAGGIVHVRNSLFYQNQVTAAHGGGLYSSGEGGGLDVEGVWFIQNTAPAGDGGAIYASHPQTTVQKSLFTANSATDGSALFLTGACCADKPTAEMVNCYIVDNPTAIPTDLRGPPAGGSSLYAESLRAILVHNTFAHASPVAAFGVHAGPDSKVEMTNNILTHFYIGIRRPSGGTGTVVASHTLFYKNDYDYDPYGITSGHEVHGDPAFVGSGNYHLTEPSAAINQGTDAEVTVDWDGESRPWNGRFDIGADEYPPRVRIFLPLTLRGR